VKVSLGGSKSYKKPKKSISLTGDNVISRNKVSLKPVKIAVAAGDPPGIIIRLFSLALNLTICYAIIFTLIPILQELNPKINTQISSITSTTKELLTTLVTNKNLAPITQIAEPFWNKLIRYYAGFPTTFSTYIFFFVTVSLFMNALFSMELGYLLCGVSVSGSPITSRIKAIVRTCLGFITAPFIIFDISAVFKRRTLKELLTFTSFSGPSPSRAIIGIVFLIPMLSVVLLAAAIFTDIEHIDGIKITKKNVPVQEFLNTNYSATSKYFKMQVKTAIPDSWILIPRFKEISGHISKEIVIYNTKDQDTATFSIFKPHPLIELLSLGKGGNPLFHLRYPTLSQIIGSNQRSMAFSQTTMNEARDLIMNSLSLNGSRLVNVLLSNGPFFNGLITLRREFIKSLFLSPETKINVISLNGRDFLEITDPQQTLTYKKLLPLDMPEGELYQVYSKSQSSDLANTFLASFIYPAKLTKLNNAPIFDDIDSTFMNHTWNSFTVIDFLNLAESLPPRFSNGIEKLFEQLSQTAKESHDKVLQKLVNSSIEETILTIKSKDKAQSYSATKTLISRLQQIRKNNNF